MRPSQTIRNRRSTMIMPLCFCRRWLLDRSDYRPPPKFVLASLKEDGPGVKTVAQAVLIDDLYLLPEIVARTLQEILGTEMTAHIGATR